jgi:poly-gamma-glutamate synthesis protein (capsule biosynthesis protein)
MKKYFLVIALFIVLIVGVMGKVYYSREIILCAVGDILLDRGVGDRIDDDYDYPYRKVKHVFEGADITFGNLECPITTEGTPALKKSILLFKANPESTPAIKEAGFDILNLANNHTMDYDTKGIINTMNILKDFNIDFIGAGHNYNEGRKPFYIKKNGCKVGFLGYSVFPPEGYISFIDRPDVAKVDFDTLGDEIKSAKKNCDFLIVSFHWGKEYEFYPGSMQKDIAHTVIDSGGDLVLGHHPHVLQGVERYKEGLIFYSLGNFIFDRQIPNGTDETIIVKLKIKDERAEAQLIPIRIKNCQPCVAHKSDAEYILKRLKLYSEGMNTNIDINHGIGYIK